MIDISRSRRRGFTLIELLIVIAIIGIVAALIIPMFLDALHKSRQKRTMAEMRLVGTCWMAWLTDQVGSGAAGSSVRYYSLASFVEIDQIDLLDSLYRDQTFFYCSEVPLLDGWGAEYEYYINPDSLVAAKVMAIRSSGRDHTWEGLTYTIGPFVTTNYNRDIVWADGLFMQYPAGISVVNAQAGPAP